MMVELAVATGIPVREWAQESPRVVLTAARVLSKGGRGR
jgi:hypothetical protein